MLYIISYLFSYIMYIVQTLFNDMNLVKGQIKHHIMYVAILIINYPAQMRALNSRDIEIMKNEIALMSGYSGVHC